MEVGAYEAKTHLPKLLARVQRGERISITKRGKVIAELCPARVTPADNLDDLFKRMDAFKARQKTTWKELYALRHQGHRY